MILDVTVDQFGDSFPHILFDNKKLAPIPRRGETLMANDNITTKRLEELATNVQNDVYLATSQIEIAEHLGEMSGNGHHVRQYISSFAFLTFIAHWPNKQQAAEFLRKYKEQIHSVETMMAYIQMIAQLPEDKL